MASAVENRQIGNNILKYMNFPERTVFDQDVMATTGRRCLRPTSAVFRPSLIDVEVQAYQISVCAGYSPGRGSPKI